MIRTEQGEARYQVGFSNGSHEGLADASLHKGGQGSGFGPHELLEASLATCINMWIRMQGDKLGIPVRGVWVTVTLRRDLPGESVFEYALRMEGSMTPAQEAQLLGLAETCPVRQTLLKQIAFRRTEG